MEYDNWKMSDDKWNPETGVLNELNKPGQIDWGRVKELATGDCGHCIEYRGATFTSNKNCHECSLNNPSTCGHFICNDGGFKIIGDMAKGRIPRNKRKARRIANRIYNQILKDTPEDSND